MEAPPHKSSASSTIRFLGDLSQPVDSDSKSLDLELDEVDVVWSTTASDLSETPAADFPSNFPRHRHHHFRPDRFGLSAAFPDDRASLLQRKTSLNPSLSAASAARGIPPVPFPRMESSSEDFSRSAPVDIPVWPKGSSRHQTLSRTGIFEEVGGGEEEKEEEEEMLPPHVIVARSHATSFSVFEGAGRTLKGRDMRRVRDAVWQKTGFLD